MSEKRYAILVGCNHYDHQPALRCPVNDVAGMEAVLKDARIGGFTDVFAFANGELNYEILAQLEEIITGTVESNDTLLIYFSGHGKQDPFGKLYLAVKNTKDTLLDSTSLSIDRLVSYIDRSRSRSILFILDCCYSGAIRGVFRKGSVNDSFVAAAQGRGLHIMTSSTDVQVSHEKEGAKYSLFTQFLLEGLETGKADMNNDGLISVDEAYTYVYNTVKGYALQTPTKITLDVKGDFILAKNIEYRPLIPPPIADKQYRKFFAVKTMIDMLQSDQPLVFGVVLFQYYIEDELYKTSMLTVSPTHTPNIRQTFEGFECDAFFTPDELTSKGQEGKEVIQGHIKVRMKVKLEDIWLIAGRSRNGEGEQINLYT